MHVPDADSDVRLLNEFRSPAQFRLIFDEFFWLECGLALKRTRARKVEGIAFSVTERAREQLKAMLPFKPTGAQKRVIQEIVNDMKQPYPMNRLPSGRRRKRKNHRGRAGGGDRYRERVPVAVLAPTEILAVQHYAYFRRLMEKLGYTVVLMTGSRTARQKQELRRALSLGIAHVAIGTHALLEEDVAFQKLGLAIVDEQHRFGVRQRLALMEKGIKPDVLVMTATPIPRTLALTVYGDLDISIIDELPPGRKPITTRHVPEAAIEKIWEFVGREIRKGRQAYVVYPVIEESETNAMKAAEKAYRQLSADVFPDLKIGLLHGKMSTDEKENAMRRFETGEIQILVSTTVVEVGVNVPNATVMVIEQAERFGLAQVHQLRGRVGRGAEQSYCFLVTGSVTILPANASVLLWSRMTVSTLRIWTCACAGRVSLRAPASPAFRGFMSRICFGMPISWNWRAAKRRRWCRIPTRRNNCGTWCDTSRNTGSASTALCR